MRKLPPPKNLNELLAMCWKDAGLKAKFMGDPMAVLAEYGIKPPADVDVNMLRMKCANKFSPSHGVGQ